MIVEVSRSYAAGENAAL